MVLLVNYIKYIIIRAHMDLLFEVFLDILLEVFLDLLLEVFVLLFLFEIFLLLFVFLLPLFEVFLFLLLFDLCILYVLHFEFVVSNHFLELLPSIQHNLLLFHPMMVLEIERLYIFLQIKLFHVICLVLV